MKKRYKSIIIFLLCASFLINMPVAASADGNALRLTVAADTHFQCFSDLGDFPTKATAAESSDGMINSEIYYYATTQGQMNYESYAIVKQLLASFAAGKDDYLLIAGDLTCGKRQSHIEFAEMLRKTERESGKEIFVVCGNHDCDNKDFEKNISIGEFKEIYADFGYNQALSSHKDSGSYTVDLSDKYRLIAIDSCIYGKDDGEISASVMRWILKQAKEAKSDGKELIGMMHHSVLPHFYIQPMIKNYRSLAEKFSDMGIKLVFTGHLHANDISLAVTKSGKTIYDIQTGSLITAPNAFRHISLGEKVNIKSEYITKINTNDLPDGYSKKQLSLINKNFAEYSAGFFEAGMHRWLQKYIGSAQKIGKTLRLSSDSAAYRELDLLLKTVGKSINMPIYDDGLTPDVPNSIEEISKRAGNTLPESNYKRIYQLVAALMGSFYRGDSKNKSMDTEVSLLFDCIEAAASHLAFNLICNGELNNLLKFMKIRLLQNGACNAAGMLVRSLITPLLQGISSDYSAPDDITAVIDFNCAKVDLDSRTPLSFFGIIVRYFSSI